MGLGVSYHCNCLADALAGSGKKLFVLQHHVDGKFSLSIEKNKKQEEKLVGMWKPHQEKAF